MKYQRLLGIIIPLVLTVAVMISVRATSKDSSPEEKQEIPEPVHIVADYQEEEVEEIILLDVEDVQAIARTLYGECRGVESEAEKAAVAWVILNRLDSGEYGDSILDIVSAPEQFVGYDEDFPLWADLVALSEDVLRRWHREKSGETNVGRVIPPEYLWFSGDGHRNHFRNQYRGGTEWDWSLENPYVD